MTFFHSGRLFKLFFCILALAKLALVADHEIVSMPYDPVAYAGQALGSWGLGAPPGYPIWLSLCLIFNVPQRIAIELLHLFAVLAVGLAFRKCFGGVSGYSAMLLLSFAPSTYFLFDLGLTDGYFASLSLLAIAITVSLLTEVGRSQLIALAMALGVVLAAMAITRNEDPLITLWILMLIVAAAVLKRLPSVSVFHFRFWRRSFQMGLITVLTLCSLVFLLEYSYFLKQGVYARGLALIPGHQELLANLARIDTGKPQVRFIPISRQSRELAYSVSPTLSKLRPLIEDPQDQFQVVSREVGLPSGEIGGGWIWHSINMRVLTQTENRPALAAAEYGKINADLQAAFASGRLKRRFILHPLLGGDLRGLMKALPASFKTMTATAFGALPDSTKDQNFNPGLFDRAFVRRAALIPHPSDVIVQGWAFVDKPGRKISAVVIGSDVITSSPILAQERPDVVKVYLAQNRWKPEVIGFRATLMSHSPDDVTITYILDDGSRVESRHLKVMQVSTIENAKALDVSIIQGIDSDTKVEVAAGGLRETVLMRLYKNLQSAVLRKLGILVSVAAFILTVIAFRWRRDQRCLPFIVFLSFASIMWISRILFYSLIDARAWDAAQVRYLMPANLLGIVIFSTAVGSLSLLLTQHVWQGKGSGRAETGFELTSNTISHI